MGRLILRGIGISFAITCWPVALPALLLALLLAPRRPQEAAAAPQTQSHHALPGAPLLGPLAASQLAIVAERNRQHLERCLTSTPTR